MIVHFSDKPVLELIFINRNYLKKECTMGRYLGPRTRVCRRLGALVFDNVNVEKAFNRNEEAMTRRRKLSEYGIRLREKQKIKYYYGMREEQMKRFYNIASRMKGNTGINFLIVCERRLDNAVASSGFAPSRAAARQLVGHGNVLVNGKKVTIPSALVNPGDTITFRDKAGVQKLIQANIDARKGYVSPDWIATDSKSKTAKIVRMPIREDVRLIVEEQLVVEFYSK